MTKVVNIKVETENTNPQAQLQADFEAMKAAYNNAPAPSYKDRKEVLLKLKKSLIENEQAIYDALKKDYGYRSEFDSLIADVLPSVAAINYALKNLKKWMKPSKRHAGLLLTPSSVTVHYQPLGVVGVITPWNFPFFLALGPAIQALAAGNRVMIKMSEFTPNANQMLRKVVETISDHIVIIEGEADMGAAFSALPFDHLIFTGSTTVGKLVAKAAADNLTPITLEMGGKSPTIIGEDANMNAAVDALIIGKSTNSGQICVSPDYVFVPEAREQEFVETFIKRYTEYHISSNNKNTHTHIITDRQYDRLQRFLDDAKAKGANIHPVKDHEESDGRLIYPHVVTNVSEEMSVMQEEIFGSILPVMSYKNVDEVIGYINARPRPLALYIMSTNNALIEHLLKNTHSGGVSINDTAMQVMADDAPFGGIGHSGMGHYHGHEGFLTFSKAKTVLHAPAGLPKNRIILKNRDLVFKALRTAFLR
ncbi:MULTISPECIES: coniferyl aldehyde dehydrogenase [unclassified Moorena]|uniref:coniferyl aldehyde dehydrogenase n=1 Tax=unclassified Moorena TaxID=2683338 RepID=UPI0014018E9E|nr:MULTISPECIES: coniferyl aldehyde dehydrogenase [unclassified Moorena]NEO15167.1 coniferyl aldehyde dehydrogenase [Moorena sp. SIO3E8]NEP98165.1 coniferyl aldehyde dehydrogenase [Moorena sp. SIO3F7]